VHSDRSALLSPGRPAAGTLAYWQAWLYMATILIPSVVLMIYLFKRDPEIPRRRMEMKEKKSVQKAIITVS
jgi:hypothetical protein